MEQRCGETVLQRVATMKSSFHLRLGAEKNHFHQVMKGKLDFIYMSLTYSKGRLVTLNI